MTSNPAPPAAQMTRQKIRLARPAVHADHRHPAGTFVDVGLAERRARGSGWRSGRVGVGYGSTVRHP
jgi:hypothetical protein